MASTKHYFKTQMEYHSEYDEMLMENDEFKSLDSDSLS